MRKFWGFYDNGSYRVGCNGGTIYIYDQANKELTKFKDIPYAYDGAFQPNTNLFAAKSTEGSLAVYDLDRLALVKKDHRHPHRRPGRGLCLHPRRRVLL